MISSLRGKVTYKQSNKIEINLNGLSYEVFLPSQELAKVTLNQKLTVFIFQHLTENSNNLYGFLNRKDKNVFELLISVSGIGPKTAIGVFSAGNGDRILQAVSQADVNFFQQVKGLGHKGAQRIIVDLKSKVGSLKTLDLKKGQAHNEVVTQALKSLGFTREEIFASLDKLPKNLKKEDEVIKYALKQLGKNGR